MASPSTALILHPSRTLTPSHSALLLFLSPTLPSTSPAFLTLLLTSPATVSALFAHHLALHRVPLVPGTVGDEMWYVANDYALAGLPAHWVEGVEVEVGFCALPLTADLLPLLHDFGVVVPSRFGWLGAAALENHLNTTTGSHNKNAPDALTHADHIRYMLSHLLEGYAAECDWAGKTRMHVVVDIADGMPPEVRVRRAVRRVMEGRGFRRAVMDGETGRAWVSREERGVGPAHRHRTHRSMSSIEAPLSPVSSVDFDWEAE